MGIMASEQDFDFFVKNRLNVLCRGLHGVGKTTVMIEALERNNIPYRYFSTPTMDPFVDFIGVPKPVWDEEMQREFLRLIIPEQFHKGTYTALIFDEVNRGKPRVRNAVMELIQFHTINGEKFNGIEMIWGGMNPEETDDADLSYDVEVLDPAQKDRFDVFVDFPYKPDKRWFESEFGESGLGAVEWWHTITDEQKVEVSPRRLEKALRMFDMGGDIRFVIPQNDINVTALRTRIDTGTLADKLERLLKQDEEARVRFFNIINNTTETMNHVLAKPEYVREFLPYMQRDMISEKVVEDNGRYMETIIRDGDADTIIPILATMLASKQVARPLRSLIKEHANNRKLDLTSAVSYKEAVHQALSSVGGTQNDSFIALHAVLQNFNGEADLDTFRDTVEFLAKMANSSKEDALRDPRKPYYQVGTNIVNRMDDSCKRLYDTDIMSVFEDIATVRLTEMDAKRIQHARDTLEFYLSERPTKKS